MLGGVMRYFAKKTGLLIVHVSKYRKVFGQVLDGRSKMCSQIDDSMEQQRN
jgi:hypothetical protein